MTFLTIENTMSRLLKRVQNINVRYNLVVVLITGSMGLRHPTTGGYFPSDMENEAQLTKAAKYCCKMKSAS